MTGDGWAPDEKPTDDNESIGNGETTGTRRADIETVHADSVVATVVAQAVRPDNTDAMDTVTDGDVVRTTIERDTTGGLSSSVDDYVVNLDVAQQVVTTTRNL